MFPTVKVYYAQSAWGGNVIASREFFNPDTKDYLHLEAHEVRGHSDLAHDGEFMVAGWVPEGNCAPDEFGGALSLADTIERMLAYVPDAGLVEMTIPEEHYI